MTRADITFYLGSTVGALTVLMLLGKLIFSNLVKKSDLKEALLSLKDYLKDYLNEYFLTRREYLKDLKNNRKRNSHDRDEEEFR